MKRSALSPLLLSLLGAAALFVWQTSRSLPPVVATHFGADGAANGFMTRTFYVRFMVAFVALLPWLVNVALAWALRMPNARINLPNRDHWLSGEQREQTIDYLLRHMQLFRCDAGRVPLQRALAGGQCKCTQCRPHWMASASAPYWAPTC